MGLPSFNYPYVLLRVLFCVQILPHYKPPWPTPTFTFLVCVGGDPMTFIQVGVIVTSEQAFFANIQESTSSRDLSKEFLISTRGPSSSLSRLITEVGSFPPETFQNHSYRPHTSHALYSDSVMQTDTLKQHRTAESMAEGWSGWLQVLVRGAAWVYEM